MDIFNEELLRLWRSLNRHQVKYIMVEGVATNLNGYQRSTEDIGLWIDDKPENRRRLRIVFQECDMGDYFMMERLQFVPGFNDFRLNNGLRVDIMVNMKGLEAFTFEECLQQATVADIEGLLVPFLQINQLIENKKAVNRSKDQLDVIYLERIKKIQEDEDAEKKD
jgi:hypothetical protein